MTNIDAKIDAHILQTPQDAECVVYTCAQCAGEIYEGEEIMELEVNGDMLHVDCFWSYSMDALGGLYKYAGEMP